MTPYRPWLDGPRESAATIPRHVRTSCSGRPHAVEHVADGAHHGGAFLGRIKKAGAVELALEMLEKSRTAPRASRAACPERAMPFRDRPVAFGGAAERRRGALRLQPFIAEQQHGLRQAERGEIRIDRRGQDGVGKRRSSSLSRPLRSGPNSTPRPLAAFARAACSSRAALSGESTGFTISRGRAVDAST